MKKLVVILTVVLLLGFAQVTLANGGGLTPPAGEKDPNTALTLSAIVPGLGQFYNDQLVYKCLFMGTLEALGWVVIGATKADWFGITVVSANHVISAFDAYIQAGKINQGLSLKMTPEGPVLAFSQKF
jgi:hypothetical protein